MSRARRLARALRHEREQSRSRERQHITDRQAEAPARAWAMSASRRLEWRVWVDSVEKLLFRSYSKNSRPIEASLLLGRGGPCDLLLRATKRLLTNAPTIHRTNCQSQRTHPRIRGRCDVEFFNRIGRTRPSFILNADVARNVCYLRTHQSQNGPVADVGDD